MSRILRRPMFRGGPVDSRGTGITSGLGYENGGRVGYDNGGQILQRARSRVRGPRDFGITNINPLTAVAVDAVPNLVVNTSTGSGALLFASIDERPDDQGEVKQVIDCVS